MTSAHQAPTGALAPFLPVPEPSQLVQRPSAVAPELILTRVRDRVGAGDDLGDDIGGQGSKGRSGTFLAGPRALPVGAEALGRGARAHIDSSS